MKFRHSLYVVATLAAVFAVLLTPKFSLAEYSSTTTPPISEDEIYSPRSDRSGASTLYSWVDWTAASPGTGTASGFITLPGGDIIDVTLQVLNPDATSGTFYGYKIDPLSSYNIPNANNFWTHPSPTTYESPEVPNHPTFPDAIALSGGTTSSYIIRFYKNGQAVDVRDPAMAIVSLGGGVPSRYNFDRDFELLSTGSGWWGGSASTLWKDGQSVIGHEGNGTIRFVGSLATFSWTVP